MFVGIAALRMGLGGFESSNSAQHYVMQGTFSVGNQPHGYAMVGCGPAMRDMLGVQGLFDKKGKLAALIENVATYQLGGPSGIILPHQGREYLTTVLSGPNTKFYQVGSGRVAQVQLQGEVLFFYETNKPQDESVLVTQAVKLAQACERPLALPSLAVPAIAMLRREKFDFLRGLQFRGRTLEHPNMKVDLSIGPAEGAYSTPTANGILGDRTPGILIASFSGPGLNYVAWADHSYYVSAV